MAAYDDPYGDAYNGPGNMDVGPGAGDGPPPDHPDWIYDPLQGVYVPPPSVIGAPIEPSAPAVAPVEPTTPPAAPSVYGNDNRGIATGASGGDLTAPYPGTFTAPVTRFPGATGTGVPATPVFNAPGYNKPPAFDYSPFMAPTGADVLADPGYQFGLSQGEKALQQSAASKGVLNTGGTLKNILEYGQDYATQRYGDVYNRNLNTYGVNRNNALTNYNTNYGTQYQDPYAIAYRSASDAFAPQMSAYSTNAAANQRANELDYSNAYDLFNFDYNKYISQQDRTFDKRFRVATA